LCHLYRAAKRSPNWSNKLSFASPGLGYKMLHSCIPIPCATCIGQLRGAWAYPTMCHSLLQVLSTTCFSLCFPISFVTCIGQLRGSKAYQQCVVCSSRSRARDALVAVGATPEELEQQQQQQQQQQPQVILQGMHDFEEAIYSLYVHSTWQLVASEAIYTLNVIHGNSWKGKPFIPNIYLIYT